MDAPVLLLESLADWATAVAALPASGPLPVRTVLVPDERHAHALRRALARSGQGAALAGTRLVGPVTLAQELLGAAGRDLRPGEGSLRSTRLRALLDEPLPLAHFDLELLRGTPGWPEAFAAAIGELEAAGLGPDTLPTTSAAWRDLALLWRRLDAAAGASATAARLLLEAEALLRAGARPATGPVLAAVTGAESAAEARFVRALPGVRLALLAARPVRERQLERVEALYGRAARDVLAAAPLPAATGTERDLLVRYLFAPADLLADPARPRSAGRDGTVELEEHAGVEAELEAAADWVAREVLEHRTPLEDVAVLFPVQDPYAALVAARLQRLPWEGGALPVHVAGGLPAVATAAGARALALVRALAAWLPAEAVAEVLPSLRAPRGERAHLSHAEAIALAWSLGTIGGHAGAPERALEWAPRVAAREARLAADVAEVAAHGAEDEREGWALRRALEVVRAARPAVEALVAVGRAVVEERPLSEIAPALLGFMEAWQLEPGGEPVRALLAGALEWTSSDAAGAAVRGVEALRVIEERLLALRMPTARFGAPAVYVGTVASAAGLEFQAVRILGVSEGALPSPGREDPVLPDRMRQEADPLRVPVTADRVLAQLQGFDRALRGARRAVVLSSPRSDLERSERETSSLLVEVGAALARPDGDDATVIPGLKALARTAFAPARAAVAAFREASPIVAAHWLRRAAAAGEIPPAWRAGAHVALDRVLALRAAADLGAAGGVLGGSAADGPFPALRGLSAERPASASALQALLRCPLGYLLEHVLGWKEPAGAPSVRELDALTYGTLFHGVVEAFYRAHGAAFVGREKPLGHWKKVATAIADARLDALLASQPLAGEGVVEKERGRLRRDLETFLQYDWELKLDRFVDVERPFGTGEHVEVQAGGVRLHLRGYIDRLDVERGHLLLRDMKTGRDHPREGDEAGPTPGRDLQLGLYGLVARRLAERWDLPKELHAAYAYVGHGEERAFRGDFAALEKATRAWLAVAAALLDQRCFPPTPVADDCAYCAFQAVCGPDPVARAARAAGAGPAVEAFLALKGVDA